MLFSIKDKDLHLTVLTGRADRVRSNNIGVFISGSIDKVVNLKYRLVF